MDVVQFCEISMLVLFGCSWPFNIAKSWKSGTAKGKSITFEILIFVGYICGITGKLITWRRTGNLAYSTWVYAADLIMVGVDLVLCFRNRQRDLAQEKSSR